MRCSRSHREEYLKDGLCLVCTSMGFTEGDPDEAREQIDKINSRIRGERLIAEAVEIRDLFSRYK